MLRLGLKKTWHGLELARLSLTEVWAGARCACDDGSSLTSALARSKSKTSLLLGADILVNEVTFWGLGLEGLERPDPSTPALHPKAPFLNPKGAKMLSCHGEATLIQII